MQGDSNSEFSRTLNDILQKNFKLGSSSTNAISNDRRRSSSVDETSMAEKGTTEKTEKDKYNTKERRNSRYYMRNGDKEAIQTHVNSVKRAMNSLMEYSGLYDHKPKHGSRKHSLAALNIPKNITDGGAQSTPPPIINIMSPDETQLKFVDGEAIVSCLSPFPDNRRSSMEEHFFASVSLPAPKQFADAASRRSSGVNETIKEEVGNGYLHEHIEPEYNYSISYLGNSEESHCESSVPYEVYERNLLRSMNQQYQATNTEYKSLKTATTTTTSPYQLSTTETTPSTIIGGAAHTLAVPVMQMSDIDMMERTPLNFNPDNIYTSENMTIIETDVVVSWWAFILSL